MSNEYVDSTIATKFGEFNIRVYAAPKGKETVVLWKNDVAGGSCPLVRIHSECLTGDAFKGLNCDCGQQLARALKKINEEGGIFIYLRQEGRGIGLFEKIKTYSHQKNGYDTLEANVISGHRPDERTYEMAKKVLDDFGIRRIRILTNNPAKISELAKFGIEISERIPLIEKYNKFNRDYFVTKASKFNHSFSENMPLYFYQFHAEEKSQVIEIGEFLKHKIKDMFLRICVGVIFTENMFQDPLEIERVRLIFETSVEEGFIPVLHFSFGNCTDVSSALHKIKKLLPFVTRLQMNDLSVSVRFSILQQAFEMFSIDFPISDDNVHLVKDKKVINLIKKNDSLVILDNSKGRGIQESTEVLIEKVRLLTNQGLNNIGLYGGFGPGELDPFFFLRSYYHLNFSIDAETKLKTNGKIDLEKTKTYLTDLLGFKSNNECVNT